MLTKKIIDVRLTVNAAIVLNNPTVFQIDRKYAYETFSECLSRFENISFTMFMAIAMKRNSASVLISFTLLFRPQRSSFKISNVIWANITFQTHTKQMSSILFFCTTFLRCYFGSRQQWLENPSIIKSQL